MDIDNHVKLENSSEINNLDSTKSNNDLLSNSNSNNDNNNETTTTNIFSAKSWHSEFEHRPMRTMVQNTIFQLIFEVNKIFFIIMNK